MSTRHSSGSRSEPPAPAGEDSRVEALSDRVQVLEKTVAKLERALELLIGHPAGRVDVLAAAALVDIDSQAPQRFEHWARFVDIGASGHHHELWPIRQPGAGGPDAAGTLVIPYNSAVEALQSFSGSADVVLALAAAQSAARANPAWARALHGRSPASSSLVVIVPGAAAEPEKQVHRPQGLAAAHSRGESAKVAWVKNGDVVSAKALSEAWDLTPQALTPAAQRGEIFTVLVKNQRYFPKEFLELQRSEVAAICKRLQGLDSSQQLVFWKRKHGALGGKTVLEALTESEPGSSSLQQVIELAEAHTAQLKADAAQKA